MTPAQKYLLAVTMVSLEEHPEDWEFTQHRAMNERLGIEIWMQNRFYGTHVAGPGIMCGEKQCAPSFMQPWRRRVVRAAERVAAARLAIAVEKRRATS